MAQKIKSLTSASTTTKQHILLQDDKHNAPKPPSTSPNTLWGRRSQVSALSGILSLSLVLTTVLFTLLIFISLQHFHGSILDTIRDLLASPSPTGFIAHFFHRLTLRGVVIYAGWVLFQVLLYSLLPGRVVRGAQTPGGNRLLYTINGLLSWVVTLGLFVDVSCTYGVHSVAALADNWGGVLVAANIYGIAMSVLAWMKGHVSPTCMKDRRLSGSVFHDFLSGIELNPRVGKGWDIKLFHVGHLGMNSWVVIDLSFAAQQCLRFGSVSNSMLIVIILHAFYVVDFFVNEAWYLNTIDIAHDHFGYQLAWGSAVWLPYIYTTQAQYLASHPIHLSPKLFWTILSGGIAGYSLFRLANHQKHLIRTKGTECQIAGRKPTVIRSRYTTGTGQVHESLLLCSGCWAVVRHPNYIGDLIFSFCTCACCGWEHVLPYTYFIYMAILLVHRCLRDEKRCLAKHGNAWEEYRRAVRWRIIPGLF